jgi:hypothetical protein
MWQQWRHSGKKKDKQQPAHSDRRMVFFFFYLALCETKPTSTAGHANARICNRKTPIPKHPKLIKHFANFVPSSLCKSKTQIILRSSKIQQVFFCSA